MGLATSKDASGRVVIPGVSPDILDYKGRDLRDELDACLNQNMWYCTALGMVLCVPVSFKYRTERPLFAAAILSPLADMWYGQHRCEPQKQAYLEHYHKLRQEAADALEKHSMVVQGADRSLSDFLPPGARDPKSKQ